MEWYNILVLILGAVGGVGGLVGLYKAKAEKTSIEVENMQSMLEVIAPMYMDTPLDMAPTAQHLMALHSLYI